MYCRFFSNNLDFFMIVFIICLMKKVWNSTTRILTMTIWFSLLIVPRILCGRIEVVQLIISSWLYEVNRNDLITWQSQTFSRSVKNRFSYRNVIRRMVWPLKNLLFASADPLSWISRGRESSAKPAQNITSLKLCKRNVSEFMFGENGVWRLFNEI